VPSHGLAPLELVLALPFLMAILAIIINLGIEARWKLDALAVSRQVVWRQRGGRDGAADPPLLGWRPPQATWTVIPNPPPTLFPEDPLASHAVTRGPVLRNPQVNTPESQLLVDIGMLDIVGSMDMGRAVINRGFPIFPRLPGVHLRVDHLLIDSQWRFWEMRSMSDPRQTFRTNEDRRASLFYGFTPPGSLIEASMKFQKAAEAIFFAPFRRNLDVLDRDDELIAWDGLPAPDFHPRWSGPICIQPLGQCTNCTLNRFQVSDEMHDTLIKAIQGPKAGGAGGVPERVTDVFIQLYQRQIAWHRLQIPPNDMEIRRLKELVKTLERLKGSLN